MIRASSLRGQSVVDLDQGAKIGQVHELVLDPRERRVAGVIVARGGSLLGGSSRATVPSIALHAIGADAVTIGSSRVSDDALEPVANLPLLSNVVGRKVLTHGGQLLGVIGDVLLHPVGCRIGGYILAGPAQSGLAGLFDGRDRAELCLKPDAEFKVGRDVVVVPDAALVDEAELEAAMNAEPPPAPYQPPTVARVIREAPEPPPEDEPLLAGLEATRRFEAVSPDRTS